MDSTPKCLNCNKNKAQQVQIVGWTYCKSCIKKQRALPKLGETIELTTSEMKEERKVYQQEILQPFRAGQLSREYAKQNPESIKKMIREGNTTVAEVKNSKNVWTENDYYARD